MTFVPDQDPSTIEWARTPPAHMLEALETIQALAAGWRASAESDSELVPTTVARAHATAYRESARILLRAFIEEYAP
jgi:hypothetical protein